jgi:glycine/D-amino acid oxidase-like deaminating enzyme
LLTPVIGGGRRLGNPAGKHGEQPILDDTTINPKISEYLTKECATYFYGHENWGENGVVLQEWTGIMGYTVDKQPVVGEASSQEGLWICAGFNGHGESRHLRTKETADAG